MKTNLNDLMVSIGNVSYKFKKETILKADKVIGHLKESDIAYKYIVGYIAICLMPSFFTVGKDLIFELILGLSTIATSSAMEGLASNLLASIMNMSKVLLAAGFVLSIVRKKVYSIGSNIKK